MRTGYAKAVALKNTVSKRILARLFNAMVTPHFLYISPLFDLLTQSEKRQLRTKYFKFAKYLLGIAPWTGRPIPPYAEGSELLILPQNAKKLKAVLVPKP
jgi:hypothetical protein